MTDSIMTAAETEFAGADLEALRAYCDRIGIEYSKNHNAATLRKLLTAATAEGSTHYSETVTPSDETIAEEKRLEVLDLVSLNLRPQAGWQGRRRTIQLHRAMAHESTRPQFFAWGRLHCYGPMGVECSIPYPIFNILKDTAGTRLTRKRKTDDEGRIYFQDVWVPTQRFMYSDMGDDPDTANMPVDMRDMVIRLHGLTDGFTGYSKRQFNEICHRMFIAVEEGWEIIDMKAAIETKCGLTAGRVQLGTPDLSQAATG